MADFDRAFAIVIGEEGGYVNDPKDPGGETKYGISKRAEPTLDIANLTLEDAKAIYRRDYWAPVFDSLPWPLDALVFDAAVNQGGDAARRLLQRALKVAEDGILGRSTLEALAKADVLDLSARYLALRALRYTGTRNFDVFGAGWFWRLFTLARKVAERP